MPRKTPPSPKPGPRQVEHDAAKLKQITGTENLELQNSLLNQLLSTTPIEADASEATQTAFFAATFAALEGLAPRNEAEGMLAVQMVATHSAAIDCLRRARLSNQTFEGRELNLKHAEKLMTIYARQVEALDKHRGKGQQKITVEHVNVHAGGQAIVGSLVSAQPNTQPGPPQSPPAHSALSDNSADSLPLIDGQLSQRPAKKRTRVR